MHTYWKGFICAFIVVFSGFTSALYFIDRMPFDGVTTAEVVAFRDKNDSSLPEYAGRWVALKFTTPQGETIQQEVDGLYATAVKFSVIGSRVTVSYDSKNPSRFAATYPPSFGDDVQFWWSVIGTLFLIFGIGIHFAIKNEAQRSIHSARNRENLERGGR